MKYHWYPLAGIQYIDRQEAARLAGENPDYAGQELYNHLASGKTAEYGLYVQLMNPQDEANLPMTRWMTPRCGMSCNILISRSGVSC